MAMAAATSSSSSATAVMIAGAPSPQNALQDGDFTPPDAHTPLLFSAAEAPSYTSLSAYTDWLGRPIAGDSALGGWKCSACLICAQGLGTFTAMGISANLVVFLVREWGWSNASGVTTVNALNGTIFLSSFLTGSLADAYMGRVWTGITFQSLIMMCLLSATCTLWVSLSIASSTAATRIVFIAMLYMISIMTGLVIVSVIPFGADQLVSGEQKKTYFKLVAIANTLGTLLATIMVTYVEEAGMWVAGYGICTVAAGIEAALIWIAAPQCRMYKVSQNPLVQIAQVFVAAWRRRSLPCPIKLGSQDGGNDPLPVPWTYRIPQASSFSFLDKAAVPSSTDPKLNEPNPWRICTVQQVEELKCLLRVIPIGISFMFVTAVSGQVTSLFEEQALVMERQVTSWLLLPAASLNFFFIAGSLFAGFMNTFGGALWIGLVFRCCRRQRRLQNLSSLQLQGFAVMLCIFAMVTAALVESWRLNVAAQDGTALSILWLIPQTIMVGASMHVNIATSFEFFYRGAPHSMQMTSFCILNLFNGFGDYLNSIIVVIITAITTMGGHKGWIPSDLNEGHLDYFYWLFASMLVVTLCIHLIYASYYTRTKKLLAIYCTFD